MKSILIGANGTIGEQVQKALAGAGPTHGYWLANNL
jgi:hypothetical protein